MLLIPNTLATRAITHPNGAMLFIIMSKQFEYGQGISFLWCFIRCSLNYFKIIWSCTFYKNAQAQENNPRARTTN